MSFLDDLITIVESIQDNPFVILIGLLITGVVTYFQLIPILKNKWNKMKENRAYLKEQKERRSLEHASEHFRMRANEEYVEGND